MTRPLRPRLRRALGLTLLAGLAALGALAATVGVATAGPRPTVLPARAESARSTPAGSKASRSAAAAQLTLVLPLTADGAGLARYAAAVSQLGNPLYHHYRSVAWLGAHFGASAATRRQVATYLRGVGAHDVTVQATGLSVVARLPRATAERLFAAPAGLTRAHQIGQSPTAGARIPAGLSGAVTGVVGLDTQPVVSSGSTPASAAASSPATASSVHPAVGPQPGASGYESPAAGGGTAAGCPAATGVGGFTPDEYLDAYGYDSLQQAGLTGRGERVALIEIDGFRASDVDTFAHCFGLRVPKIVAFRTSRAVSSTGLPAGGEATLDLELLDAAAPGLSQIDVYESTPDIASALVAMTKPLTNRGYKPQIISASLGLCEPQVRQALGTAGLNAVEATFQEAAASGISVLAASGDDGSADCVGSGPSGLPDPQLAVNFPASSPWVTSVGGTNVLLNSANQITEQVAWNDGAEDPGSAGGGGDSILFRRPFYQTGVVTQNARALPDVSGLADVRPGYDIYCTAAEDCLNAANSDPWMQIGGTSASTPLLAGGLALVDQDLRLHRRSSLGFVNPLLYSFGQNASDSPLVFSDVTSGSNDVGPYIQDSHQPLGCCSAVPGFDDATGWGSVNLSGLASLALVAEPAIVNVTERLTPNRTVVRTRAIYDNVSCSGACQLGASASITIGSARPVTVRSGLYHLSAAGTRRIRIPLSSSLLTQIRAALSRREAVSASVVGAIVDTAGNVESQTASIRLLVS